MLTEKRLVFWDFLASITSLSHERPCQLETRNRNFKHLLRLERKILYPHVRVCCRHYSIELWDISTDMALSAYIL